MCLCYNIQDMKKPTMYQSNISYVCVKSPNTLSDIFKNLLKLKSYEIVLVLNITKAYNSIDTGIIEKSLCRFWMKKSPEEIWKVYGFNCVQLGD